MWSAIGSFVMILLYMFVPMDNTALLFVGIPLFAIFLMKFPPMGPFMTELYPTEVRGTAQGFCYNAGRAIGSFLPAMVGFVSQSHVARRRDRPFQRLCLWAHDRDAAYCCPKPAAAASRAWSRRRGVPPSPRLRGEGRGERCCADQLGPGSRSSISRKFCTAAPDAPLPRLSSWATSTAWRRASLAQT